MREKGLHSFSGEKRLRASRRVVCPVAACVLPAASSVFDDITDNGTCCLSIAYFRFVTKCGLCHHPGRPTGSIGGHRGEAWGAVLLYIRPPSELFPDLACGGIVVAVWLPYRVDREMSGGHRVFSGRRSTWNAEQAYGERPDGGGRFLPDGLSPIRWRLAMRGGSMLGRPKAASRDWLRGRETPHPLLGRGGRQTRSRNETRYDVWDSRSAGTQVTVAQLLDAIERLD